jgi:hypothetical protein
MATAIKTSPKDHIDRVAALVEAAGIGIADIEAGRCVTINNRADLDAHFDKIAQKSISNTGESQAA